MVWSICVTFCTKTQNPITITCRTSNISNTGNPRWRTGLQWNVTDADATVHCCQGRWRVVSTIGAIHLLTVVKQFQRAGRFSEKRNFKVGNGVDPLFVSDRSSSSYVALDRIIFNVEIDVLQESRLSRSQPVSQMKTGSVPEIHCATMCRMSWRYRLNCMNVEHAPV